MSTVSGRVPLSSGRSVKALLVAICVALGAGGALVVVAAHLGRSSASPRRAGAVGGLAAAPATFLRTYEQPDGRVVRTDQGGDTVSEGQAYAMLVAAVTGDRARFAAAWGWARAHLSQPDGLMAWRWQDGRVVDRQPATDADLVAADALVVASEELSDPGYLVEARSIAAAVMTHDVAATPSGPVLAAGPWATSVPVYVDPSYLDTPALSTVARAFGGRWPALLSGARRQLAELTSGGTLPSDWAVIGADGSIHPTAPPSTPGAPVRFGYDAARTAVWLGASCDPSDRATAAAMAPALRRGGGSVELDLGGSPAPGQAGVTGEVALATAEDAAGIDDRPALASALGDESAHPTYYGAALLAFADLASLHRLGGC